MREFTALTKDEGTGETILTLVPVNPADLPQPGGPGAEKWRTLVKEFLQDEWSFAVVTNPGTVTHNITSGLRMAIKVMGVQDQVEVLQRDNVVYLMRPEVEST